MQIETIINWNGGEYPIERLFELLATEPLHPNGNFVSPNIHREDRRGFTRFHGNFWAYSHTFSVDSNDPVMVVKLCDAIKANKETEAYKEARRIVREDKAKRLKEHQAWMRKTGGL